MRKRIGAKIIVMLVIVTIMYLVTIVSGNFSREQALGGLNRLYNSWVQLERLELQVVKAVESNKMSSNMIVWYPNEQAQTALANSVLEQIKVIEATFKEMHAIVDKLDAADLSEVTKEEVNTALTTYENAIKVLNEQSGQVASLFLAGDAEGAKNANNGASANITAATEAETNFLNLVKTASDNLIVARRAKVSSIGSISDVMFFVYLAVVAVIVFIVIRTIANPAKVASNHLNNMIQKIDNHEGDLTERIEVKTTDEVGQLVVGVNNFIEQLQGIMLKIRNESSHMNELVNSITGEINESNESASSISATMEELSASMEEVSATLDEITTGAQEILDASKDMSNKAENGKEFVASVKVNAVSIRDEATESKESTLRMIEEIRGMLEVAIQNSRSVEKINELTNDILGISSQTNLLALNASIEAARAGDAGKGFAVVADEIRVLADNSRDTANNIQSISGVVTAAVEELAKNANDMIAFIDNTIIADYDKFVDTANTYHNDADHMDEILQEFFYSACKLADTMEQMTEGIDGINVAVDESAQGVTLAAQSTGQLVEALVNIKTEADTNREISDELQGEVDKFKNI